MNAPTRIHAPLEVKMTTPARRWSPLLALLCISGAFAQSNLSRDQALRASLETPAILAAQARLSAAEAQALATNVPVAGNVNIGYGWNGSDPKPSNGEAIKGDWNYGLQINFNGIFGEANTSRVQAALNLTRNRLGLAKAQLRANASAVQLWHNLRRNGFALETARAARELAETQDKASETRLQSGAINQSERDNARFALQSAQLDEARAQNRLEAAQLQLEITLGLNGEAAIEWQALPSPPAAANLELREDVFEARAALTSSELDLDRARRAAQPTLNLDAGLQGTNGSLNLKLNSDLATGLSYTNPSANWPSNTTTWNIGIGLNWGLDPAKLGALPALERGVQAARAALEATLKAAKADTSAKRGALGLARVSLSLSERQLELAKQTLERTRQRFASGIVSALEVKRAESDALKARDALLNAQAELDSSVLEVFEAINQPVNQP